MRHPMLLLLSATAIAAALGVSSAGSAAADAAPSPASVEAHVAHARQLAGDDLKALLPLCQPQPAVRASGPALDHFLDRAIAAPSPPPGQAFDNLYYIATSWVSAWALKTSDGIILIDALNNTREAQELIEGGMVKLGLDPAQIKFVVITHAHGDHYGGANYFVQKYKARVIASEADWAQMDGGVLEFPYKDWMSPPKRDRVVKDGEALTLGDTTMTFYVTPGHTLGTVSPVFNVTSGGRPHTVMLWGGTAFNFGKDVPRLETYIAATDRMAGLARTLPVDVLISNHPGYDGSLAKAKLRAERGAQGPNPFVIGPAAVERALQVMGTCARAQRDRFLTM
jgi:metallo-beta-lactamase class B